jgi:hypothetical protein
MAQGMHMYRQLPAIDTNGSSPIVTVSFMHSREGYMSKAQLTGATMQSTKSDPVGNETGHTLFCTPRYTCQPHKVATGISHSASTQLHKKITKCSQHH